MYSLITTFLNECFYHEWMSNFLKDFLRICEDNIKIFFLRFISMVYDTNRFPIIEPTPVFFFLMWY